jgi:GTP cyclohydrolase I
MPENDPELGERVAQHIRESGCETPMVSLKERYNFNAGNGGQVTLVRRAHATIMLSLGLDLTDDSLKDTPHRVEKMYCSEVFTGLDYNNFPKCTTVENKAKYDEMVAVRKADVLSMCEHHFQAFVGHAAVAYIPRDKVLGLSKINRVVDFFARRPQIQERLTMQIACALSFILETDDVAVVIKAEHFCVRLRGVKQQSETITSKMGGKFFTNHALREEFLALTR